MANIIHGNDRAKKKSKEMISKKIFQVDEQFSFWRNYGKCKKTYRHQTCNNRKRRNYLVSQPSYHSAKFFTENLLE